MNNDFSHKAISSSIWWRGALWLLVGLLLAPGPAALAGPSAAAGPEFIAVRGDQFVLRDEPVVIKGANSYQRDAPWADMWREWRGPQVDQEVAIGAERIGLNALRVLVPFGRRHGWTDDATGEIDPVMLDRLRQMVQIAGKHDLRLIITLFDFDDAWPVAGTPGEAARLRYLETIVTAFRDDDRVLAWDLHNEPDFYGHWRRDRRPD